jgi:PKD repeat protein
MQSTWYHALVGTGSCGAVSDSLELIVPPPLTASFYYTQGSANQLIFNSDSSGGNIKSYHWDFGDGQTSNDSNPSHTFAKDSTYYVCLTLYDGSNCSYTFCRYSSVTDAVQTISASGNWIIYPDPFSSQLTVRSSQLTTGSKIQSIEMYDVLGQVVLNELLGNSTNTSFQLNVSSLAKGMYYVMIRTANADYVQKVVKQ